MKPEKYETKAEFIERFMNDSEMIAAYEDKQERRIAASKSFIEIDELNLTLKVPADEILPKIREQIDAFLNTLPVPKDGLNGKDGSDGNDGQDGATPVKGVDYFTDAEIQGVISEVSKSIPEPKIIENIITNNVPRDLTQAEVDEIAAYIISLIKTTPETDIEPLKKDIKELQTKVNAPRQAIHTGGGAKALNQLNDVSISAPSNNQVLKYNSTTGRWENGAGGAGGATAWGDITGTLSSQTDLQTALTTLQTNIDAYKTAQVYTVTNGTTDRAFNADSVTINELADVLATLIADLKSSGIIV